MEEEFDLRPYLQAITRRWMLLLVCALGFALVAGAAVLLAPQPVRAQADLFIAPRNPELTLDPRFTDRDASLITNAGYQRQALIDLGTSSMLESRVAERLGRQPGGLLGQIEVTAPSDLMRVVASAPSEDEAMALAEAWATGYQELVGELYAGPAAQLDQITADLAEAQQQFDAVQADVDAFYAAGDLVRAEQEVLRLEGLLQGGSEAQVSLYTQHLTRTQELNLILEDARALQSQYEAGGADLGAGLSALAVRARLAGAEQLPVQLSFASAESFAQGQASAADLARFVAILEAERDRMVVQADALARDLAAGNTSAVGLPAEVRASYETELAAAKGALARAEGQEELLLQRRELALKSLEVLQNRADELRIDQSITQVNVRLVGVAPVPPRSTLTALLINGVAAAMAGLVVGVILALVLEWLQNRRRAQARDTALPEHGERPADRPVASD